MTIDIKKLKSLAESVPFHSVPWFEADSFGISRVPTPADREFIAAANPAAVLELIAENERLTANVKLNLCDYPAIHSGDVDLLIRFVSGTSQIELAELHQCTPPNISRKIRRVKARLGWKKGMGPLEIHARADQLRALASQGAVVTADLMAERDQLKADNESWRLSIEAERRVHAAALQGLQAELDQLKGPAFSEELAALRKDRDRMDALEGNYWDVRHSSEALADTGDYTSGVEVIGRWMDKPFERVIGENYTESLRAAIDQAMTADAYPPVRPEYPELDAAMSEESSHD